MTSDAERQDGDEPAVDRQDDAQPDVVSDATEPGDAGSQDAEEPAAVSQANQAVEAYEEMVCAVCEKPIESGSQYIPASYGPVHTEPSHDQ